MTVENDLDFRLLDVLRSATGRPWLAYASEPVSLTGGFWAELVAFSLADPPPEWPGDLVARVMPDAALARKETIIQGAAAAAGYPTPVIRASGGPETGLGRAFMVMDLAAGAPLLGGLTAASALPAMLHRATQIPDVLASAMADLHALDPGSIRDQLSSLADLPVTLPGMLHMMRDAAAGWQRADLARAAGWLIDHPSSPAPDVICHGDLHPFNVLSAAGRLTVLDWSASLLAPRAYDVAFTTSMLSEPPLTVPAPLMPLVRLAGRLLARRFIRRYEAHAAVAVDHEEVRWHRAVVALRALTEVAGWVHEGDLEARAGHPWLACGPALAEHLTAVTGVTVRPR